MSLVGHAYYRMRRYFRHGFIGSLFRERHLPQILTVPPVRDLQDSRCEIHVLTSSEDWLCLAWTLYSFYAFSGRRYRLCIHDDGSLPDHSFPALQRLFPEARLIPRAEADSHMTVRLRGLPSCQSARSRFPLCLKSFDFFAFAEADRLLFLDCDVLFFHFPHELIRRIEEISYLKSSFNRDWRYGYTVAEGDWPRLVSFPVTRLISTGLGLMQRRAVNFENMESLLDLPGMQSHPHRVEQTLLALSASAGGYEMLPHEYDVHMGPTPATSPSRHYSGPARPLFYTEGLRRLLPELIS